MATTCTDAPPRGPRPWLALGATMAVQILATVGLSAAGVLAPAVAPELGLRPEQVGWFAGTGYLVAMLGGISSGRWVSRLGAMRVSLWLLVIVAVGALVASSGWPGLILVGAALVGLSNGMTNPTSAELLGRHAPVAAAGSFFALKQTAVPVGVGLAGICLPWGLAHFGWQAAIWALALACLVLALLLLPAAATLDAGRRRDVPAVGALESLAGSMREPALPLSRP